MKLSSFNQTICANQTYTWNGIAQNTSGTYKDTFPSYKNCDSIVILNLTVNPMKSSSFNQTICSNQTYTWNGIARNITGSYLDTFTSFQNCDSVVTLNLTVNTIKSSSFNQTICANQTYTWNGIVQNTSGTYKDTFPSYQNCDSIVILNLMVNPIPDKSTGLSGLSITANQDSALYQWINCKTSAIIAGATAKVFVAPSEGSYKVAIEFNNCKDTSSCVLVKGSNSITQIQNEGINIYPNPVSNKIQLRFESKDKKYNRVSIFAINGQMMYEQVIDILNYPNSIEIYIKEYAVGIYYIRLSNQTESNQTKFIKE